MRQPLTPAFSLPGLGPGITGRGRDPWPEDRLRRGRVRGICCLVLLLSLAVAGCGKKNPPQPPPGVPNTYPRTYPSA